MEPNEKGYKNVNGIRMYYEIYGAGKPLILIHGGVLLSYSILRKLSQD